MSPELINNKGYLFKSDIWSAGCILYEMITLEKAFNGSFFEICRAITDGVIPEVKTTPILEYLLKK
jgi:serine/threonine protein kinase